LTPIRETRRKIEKVDHSDPYEPKRNGHCFQKAAAAGKGGILEYKGKTSLPERTSIRIKGLNRRSDLVTPRKKKFEYWPPRARICATKSTRIRSEVLSLKHKKMRDTRKSACRDISGSRALEGLSW